VAPLGPCTTSTGFNTSVSSAGNPLRRVDKNLVIPESYQFNIGFEREVVKGWSLEVNFTTNKTVHLWRDRNGNVPVLPSGYADWTAYLLANDYKLANQNATIRTYHFVLGSNTDASGVTTCSFTTTNTCNVNLNSINFSTTAPAAASTGNNNNATGAPVGIARSAIAQFRPNPSLGETSSIGSGGEAWYEGLVVQLRSRYRRWAHGFGGSFRLAYTLSKTMDDGLNNTANAQINGDFPDEWARSLQDRRHRIAFSGSFDTPSWMGKLRFSPLWRWGSSAPFNLGTGLDRNLDDVSTDRPIFIGNLSDVIWRAPGSTVPSSLLAQFSLPTIGAKGGNLPRNAGIGPSFYTFDLTVTREFKLADRIRMRPDIEAYNLLNAAVFSYGSGFINFNDLTITSATTQSTFLVPTRTFRSRQFRFGIRFDF